MSTINKFEFRPLPYGYAHGQITEGFLKAHLSDHTKNVYVCGPPPMMDAIEKQLANLKIDKNQIIKEVF